MVACRFSLARLFVMTGFAAIACAALARPTPFWLPTIVSVTAAFLFYAVLAAIYRVGARGAFWRGMAIVGWGYFLLVLVAHPSSDEHVPLLTTQFIMLVHDLRHPASDEDDLYEVPYDLYPASPVDPMGPHPEDDAEDLDFPTSLPPSSGPRATYKTPGFSVIGECLWALLLGCVGGLIARRLHAARDGARSANSL